MSVNKLVLLKLVNSCSAANKNSLQQARTNGDDGVLGKAVLVLKVDGDSASIENSRPVKISSHQAWTTFQVKYLNIFNNINVQKAKYKMLTSYGWTIYM